MNGIERQIQQLYMTIYKQVFDKQNVNALSVGSRINIEQSMFELTNSDKFNEFAKKFAIALAKRGLNKQRGTWRKFYEAARNARLVGLPSTYQKFEYQQMSNAVQHNFEMIHSVPQRMLEILNHKYTSVLIEEVAKGSTSRGSFARMLKHHGVKQAGVIARTETAKLQTAITKSRSLDLNVLTYTWKSSHDRRTRHSHAEMNNVIVFWRPDNQKPLLDGMRGDAGEFPNCRCDAQPNVDINDFTESRYRVYDYRTDKIISVGRLQLLNMLERGKIEN